MNEITNEPMARAAQPGPSRVPNVDAPQHQATIVLSGSWQVQDGHQVISLGYVYPDGTSAPPPALPGTAMSAP